MQRKSITAADGTSELEGGGTTDGSHCLPCVFLYFLRREVFSTISVCR